MECDAVKAIELSHLFYSTHVININNYLMHERDALDNLGESYDSLSIEKSFWIVFQYIQM